MSVNTEAQVHPVRAQQLESILEIGNLCTNFDLPGSTVRAVRDVSFQLRPGQRLAVVGESGSGKSALAMSLVGLVPPPGRVASGSVKLRGRELVGLGDREISKIRGNDIGLVFQDPMAGLDPLKTIGSQFVDAIRVHQDVSVREAKELACQLLSEVGVEDPRRRINDYPHQYSGGMRQRVLIAMAIANDPVVLVADEPTTALDVTTQRQVLELLEKICDERGNALVMITHNLGIVRQLCDSVNVMYAGRIVEQTSTDALFAEPAHPYTRALLNCMIDPRTTLRGRLPAIPGSPPDLSLDEVGCAFAERCLLGSSQSLCHEQRPEPVLLASGAISRCHFAQTPEGATP
ncbi:ABC transporter ATP-binding protein [Paeniglutamicibacter kerguelensis]|uniref:Oligopeptide/dipeptide ABC transporter ATP-binding protein n=1 Tax=Paeniglutamicibacter kerguelensis TaxID=254788 RepID=A0ABS4X9P8_9MICC|nr:ABC transporter ATP-binding protein [Paeniglutamicibacter kerguelensis]MBP2385198.1 oligopeptide/dipeptide ABC transporter ATP-binding protein [Paeniglutamicibacter kerguelensis]